MYSPTTRLLAVLALLQSRQEMSGSEIASRLEVDVRTVRRYIVMLQDMGIPVEAERGKYGAYHLERGRQLPPLMYTDAEAIAIILGLLGIREFRFPVELAAVESALAKTERVLPENILHQARSLQESITFYGSSHISDAPDLEHKHFIVMLSSAIQAQKRVHLQYRSWRDEESERDFDPYGILFNEGYWYTAGYCHTRQDLRTFRLDRIVSLKPLTESFERPENFDILAHVLNSLTFMSDAQEVEVLLKTTMEKAQELLPPIMGSLEATDEGVIFRRRAFQLEWIAYVLIGADFPVIIKQPQELRDILQAFATQALTIADASDG